jgi:hypothetical protein
VNQNTSDNTNRNINESKSEQTINQNIKQEAPPASAIAPSIMSYSQDLCTVGRSGAFQGQLFGISGGRTVRDENCERLKLSKYLYDMGMKVASVALLCQDIRVFKAMMMAGTPCPYNGAIGDSAKSAWIANINDRPDAKEHNKSLKQENKVVNNKADGKTGLQQKVKKGRRYWRDYWKICKHEKISNGSLKSKKACRVEYERVSTADYTS